MRKQPDFHRLFHDYIGEVPRKVTYEVRQGPNQSHDLVLLGALIHDARFSPEDVRLRRNRLEIRIERDCWEFGLTARSECFVAAALLTIHPAIDIDWRFEHTIAFSPEARLEIQDVWFGDPRDGSQVIIDGVGFMWRCIVTVRERALAIRLKDLEVPRLWSDRERAKQSRPRIKRNR